MTSKLMGNGSLYLLRMSTNFFRANLSSTALHHGPNKDTRQSPQNSKYRKEGERTNQDGFQQKSNPFRVNKGVSRQLRNLGLDVDDPVLNNEDFQNEAFVDHTLESRRDESKAFRKQWQADKEHQQKLAKRKIVEKKMFPKEPNPNLLTWLEKEMIRYLHRQDPVEWNHQRLSESFPATISVIHKVLRGKTLIDPPLIEAYNKDVINNWKLLSRGQLKLSPEYTSHLAESGSHPGLTPGHRMLVEQEILTNIEQMSLAVPRPAIPGPWGKLVKDYKDKVIRVKEEEEDRADIGEMFGNNSLPSSPQQDKASPYGGTAILKTDIDLAKEKPMDSETFKKKFLNSQELERKQVDDGDNPYRRKYLAWVRKEERKDRNITKSVAKLDVEEIDVPKQTKIQKFKPSVTKEKDPVNAYMEQFQSQTLQPKFVSNNSFGQNVHNQVKHKGDTTTQHELASVRQSLDTTTNVHNQSRDNTYANASASQSGDTTTYVHNPLSSLQFHMISPDRVSIPVELQNAGYTLYRLGNSVYSKEGELVYRVVN